MLTGPAITDAEVIHLPNGAAEGDDNVFVQGGGESGWYGPVNARYAIRLKRLGPRVIGAAVGDLHCLLRRILASWRGPIDRDTSWAIGALDCAARDLRGHLAGLPVADLLAGTAPRRHVPAYFSWLRQDLALYPREEVSQVLKGGWVFTKWGLRSKQTSAPEAEAAVFAEAVEDMAAVAGEGLAVDAVGTWSTELLLAFARGVEPTALHWLEDPLALHDLGTHRRLVQAGLPLAAGERITLDDDPRRLLNDVQPSALTIDVVGCGGLTRAMEVLTAARGAGVPVYPHGRSLHPGVHLAAAFPDAAPAVEYRHEWEPRRQRHYLHRLIPEQGHLRLAPTPGLGTTPRT